ncbi:MAG TPA: TIGR01777 family oxidoreductase [Candidatus Cybelea sp.]|jgi:hypothetical protein|nr:TIGR01777 family oxidoreductase [Candidatus Cybelea sp.]
MRVLLLGASGFVGNHLAPALRERGDVVTTASLRDPGAAANRATGCDAIVNLAGESLAQRWTPSVKRRIAESRIDSPRRFLQALSGLDHRCTAYVSASAIGYYGTSESETFVESSPPGSDFVANVCEGWEREALRGAELGMRVAIVRTGIALGTDGGALAKILPPFRAGMGGVVGNGRQWFSWIHIGDLVRIYLMAIDAIEGAVNASAPNPVRNADFTNQLGEALHRPAKLPVPTFALRALLGEGAEIVLRGQRVLPQRTQELGYRFEFERLTDALANLL